jgi:hypothetical protein
VVQRVPVCLLAESLSLYRTHQYLRAKEVAEGAKSRNFILEYFTRSHAKSETIDIRTLEFRFKTMTNFLKNGTPLLKIDGFRDYLQDISGMSLTASTHMRQLLPSLVEQEVHTIKEEIAPHLITIIFDGSTRVSEVFSIIFRYCTNDFKITERLVELGNYAHGFNHRELVSAVKVIISKYDFYLGSTERGKIMDNRLSARQVRVCVYICCAKCKFILS